MKTILIGYPGSQKVAKMAKLLIEDYTDFETVFLNYEGDTNKWSDFLVKYLETITDEKIIFALDDYLIEEPINKEQFEKALAMPCPVKLCECSEEEQLEYPITTQFTIWEREHLIEILKQTTHPWDFEMKGSRINTRGASLCPCLKYDVHSALSSRWDGIKWGKLSEEDKIRCQNI